MTTDAMPATNKSSTPAVLTPRNCLLALAVTLILLGVYWFTYSGTIISTDEMGLFDAAESMARRGNMQVSYTLNLRLLRHWYNTPLPHTALVSTEPLQPILSSWFFRVAESVPGIGMVHTVWTMNVILTALTGGVMLLFTRALGYNERVAVVAGVLFGVTTIVWPYSKVFFREPLFMFCLFAAALCLHVWRLNMARWTGWLWFAGFAFLLVMAFGAKEAAYLIIPTMIVIGWPAGRMTRNWRFWVGLGLLTVATGLIIFVVINSFTSARSYDVLTRIESVIGREQFAFDAIAAFLFSPGRSIWVFSPILLLALPGITLLTRQRKYRNVLVPVSALVVFILGYSLGRNENWFGGLGWGPRYLVPAVPFVFLATLPVLKRVLHPSTARWERGLFGVLIGISIWAQLNGVLVSQTAYFDALSDAHVIAWQEGVWSMPYTPILLMPQQLLTAPIDFAWVRIGGSAVWQVVTALSFVLAGVIGIIGLNKRSGARFNWRVVVVVYVAGLIFLSSAFYVGLRSLYDDPEYMGDFVHLRDLVDTMADVVPPDDIIVLTNPEYQLYMMNYYRAHNLLYTYPLSPGEQPSPEQPPVVTSNNPDMLLESRHAMFLNYLGEYTDNIWLVNNSGPFTGFTVRPVEWAMARHYYPVEEFGGDQTTRLVRFSVNSFAPDSSAVQGPESVVNAVFGDEVELLGYDMPPSRVRIGPYDGQSSEGTTYQSGDVVPLSLLWRALQPPSSDYNVGVFVIPPGQPPILERHGPPQYAFMPMNMWDQWQTVRDNYGLQLPENLASGTYEIWVKVYAWQTGEALPIVGGNVVDNGNAVHIATIQIDE